MRKILILFTTVVISLILTACTGEEGTARAPEFLGVRIENSDPVVDGNLVEFYRGKQETVLVEISLNNPDNLEIKSVVIDGYTHTSTKFYEDSSNNFIRFDLNVGSTVTEKTYSVDKINYFEGDQSKSINVTTNNEFYIYVYKDEPTVTRENYTLERNSISIDFQVTDIDDVIEDGSLIAFLYTGDTKVDEQLMTTGLDTVLFDGLFTNRDYEIKVFASYDISDTNGLQSNVVLYSESYKTLRNALPSASILNPVVTSNNVTFDIDFTDNDNVVINNGLRVGIFREDIEIDSIAITGDTTGLSFDNLLNDNEYQIRVLADYDLNDSVGVQTNNVLGVTTINTLPRALPFIVLNNLDLQENSIEFDVFIDDETGIIDDTTLFAKLYVGDTFIEDVDIINYSVDFQVNNLFANGEFTVEIIGDYDLNDGQGVRSGEVLFARTFSTLENIVPQINISTLTISQGYVNLNLIVNDPNSTLMGDVQAVLYEEGTAVDTITFDATTTQVEFDYPTESGLSYYIEFYADYNLRDGNGAVLDATLRRVVLFTAEAKAPIAEIGEVTATTDQLDFTVTVIDADDTIGTNETVVGLYLDGALVDSELITVGPNNITFTGLLSDNTYEIIVQSDYNLEDGSGVLVDQVLGEVEVDTEAKVQPTAIPSNQTSTETSLAFDVEIVDEDGVVEVGSAEAALYLEGVLIASEPLTIGDNFDVEFDGLLSDNNYEIIITLNYDLNDGEGLITDFEVTEFAIRTTPKYAPTGTIVLIGTDETSITVDVSVTDPYDVITGNIKAILQLNGIATGDEVILAEGTNSNVVFNGVFSNERYTVLVVADYDLNNGDAPYVDTVIGVPLSAQTLNFDVPTASLENSVATSSTIVMNLLIRDDDATITGNLQAVLYLNDVATGDTVALTTGSNGSVTFNGLASDTQYEVRIVADYDMNESTGPLLAEELLVTTLSTTPLQPPISSFTNTTSGTDSITFNVDITDVDSTISGSVIAALYKDGIAEGPEIVLSVGANSNLSFTGLQSNAAYEVRILADYDLSDGVGVQTDMLIDTTSISTIAKTAPTVALDSVLLTRSTISFTINLIDIDDVFVDGSLIAALYVNGNPQSQKPLLTNNVTFNVTGMLADYDFEIRFFGDFDLADGNGLLNDELMSTYEFTTLAYEAPTALITDVQIRQSSVDVDITVLDDETVIQAGSLIAVLVDEDNVPIGASIPLVVGSQSISFPQNLGVNTAYGIVVYADYNLLDGTGTQQDEVLVESFANVYNKRLMEAIISNIVTTQNSITFDATILDNDDVIDDPTLEVRLYLNGVEVDDQAVVVGPNAGLTFTGLQSDTTYELRFYTDYNNGDGNGMYTNVLFETEAVTTDTKTIPSAEVLVDTIAATELIFDITITDPDAVSTARVANLYDASNNLVGTAALAVGGNFNVTFSGLLGNSNYTLKIDVTYDLDDGVGSQELEASSSSHLTLASGPPTASITSTSATLSTIDVEYDFADDDAVSTEQYLRLYDGAVLVDELAIVVGTGQTHTFTELTPNADYTVRIESTYDLNDMNGVQTDTSLVAVEVSTDSFITVIGSNVDETSQNILQIAVDDYEGLLTDTEITATLYEGAVTIDSFIFSDSSISTLNLFNLLSEYEYVLEFEATYDVGNGPETEVIFTYTFELEALLLPELLIEPFEFWQLSPTVEFDLTVGEDSDSVVVDSSWEAQLWVNGAQVETIDIDATYGNPELATTTISFLTPTTGTDEYNVRIVGLVDLQNVPAEGAVITVIDSVTGIDAGNN